MWLQCSLGATERRSLVYFTSRTCSSRPTGALGHMQALLIHSVNWSVDPFLIESYAYMSHSQFLSTKHNDSVSLLHVDKKEVSWSQMSLTLICHSCLLLAIVSCLAKGGFNGNPWNPWNPSKSPTASHIENLPKKGGIRLLDPFIKFLRPKVCFWGGIVNWQ